MAATTQEVLTHHLDTFGKGDLAGVMADYSPESRLFTPNGMLKGPEAIRQMARAKRTTRLSSSPPRNVAIICALLAIRSMSRSIRLPGRLRHGRGSCAHLVHRCQSHEARNGGTHRTYLIPPRNDTLRARSRYRWRVSDGRCRPSFEPQLGDRRPSRRVDSHDRRVSSRTAHDSHWSIGAVF